MARFRLVTILSVASCCAFAVGGCGGDDDDDDDGYAGALASGGYQLTGGSPSIGGSGPTGGGSGGTTGGSGGTTGGSGGTTGGSGGTTGGSGGTTGGSGGTTGGSGGTTGGAAGTTGGTAGAPPGGAAGEAGMAGTAGEAGTAGMAGGAGVAGMAGEAGMAGMAGAGGAPGCNGCAVLTLPWGQYETGGAGGAGGAQPVIPENAAVLIDMGTAIDVSAAAARLRIQAPGATGGYLQVFVQYADDPDGAGGAAPVGYPNCYKGWTALNTLDTMQYLWVSFGSCDPPDGYTWIGIQVEAGSDTSFTDPTVLYIDEIALFEAVPTVGPWTFDDESSISDTQWSDTDVMWLNSASDTGTLTWIP